MSKNVTLITYPEGTLLKSYDTYVAIKPTEKKDFGHAENMVTEKHHSKTTSRHINEFFGSAEEAAKTMKVSQKTMDAIGKFLEEYHK